MTEIEFSQIHFGHTSHDVGEKVADFYLTSKYINNLKNDVL